MPSLKAVLFFACATLVFSTAAHATLPAPLIDLDASALTTTSMVTWPNAGSLGGKFNVSLGTSVTVSTVSGRKAATFTGTNGMLSTFTPATAITGTSATYTVAYWALNPNLGNEEWILTWAPRGKGNGTYAGFGYGRNAAWGFTAHWGMVYDTPFGDIPTTNTWHHIAVTYDGYVEKGYVDGALNMVVAKKMNIGSEAFKLGYADTPTNPLGFSGSIARLQVFDKTFTQAQILELYGGTPAKAAALPTPLLDLEAAWLTTGTLSSWGNDGTLGGSFNLALGSAPTVGTVSGVQAVTFSGSNGLQADVAPPASLKGNGKFTVAYWAFNPAIANEEWLLQWAPRNKGNGTYAAFGYGTNATFGVSAHWGDTGDMVFGNALAAARCACQCKRFRRASGWPWKTTGRAFPLRRFVRF
jgi:hypothetical protein